MGLQARGGRGEHSPPGEQQQRQTTTNNNDNNHNNHNNLNNHNNHNTSKQTNKQTNHTTRSPLTYISHANIATRLTPRISPPTHLIPLSITPLSRTLCYPLYVINSKRRIRYSTNKNLNTLLNPSNTLL